MSDELSALREDETRGYHAEQLKEQLEPYFQQVEAEYIAEWLKPTISAEQGDFLHRNLVILSQIRRAIQIDVDNGLAAVEAIKFKYPEELGDDDD